MMNNDAILNPYARNVSDLITVAIQSYLQKLQCCIPAIVKEVKSREQVVVSPAVQQTDINWNLQSWASIMLPVYTPQGGKGLISFPVSVGDTGWIIAGDLDPSLFMKDPTKSAGQKVYDRHKYQYGFFLPAIMKDYGIDSADDGGIVIKNGNTKIVIKENEIDIVSNNALKINANSVNITSSGNNVVIDGLNFKDHTHTISNASMQQVITGEVTITGNLTTGDVDNQ